MPRRYVLLVAVALLACKSGDRKAPAPAGVIAQITGSVARGPAAGELLPAAVGTKLFLGDYVRTDPHSTALLALEGGGKVAMEPDSTVVLRARDGRLQLEVGAGAAVLDGEGTYALEMGQVNLVDGRVRVAATNGKPSVELVLGHGTLLESGQERRLEMGQVVLLDMGKVSVTQVDAAVAPDAAAVVPVDAAVAPVETVAVEITGDGAEALLPDEKQWTKLPAGAGTLPARAKLRVNAKSSATLTAPGAILALGGGSRVALGEHLAIAIEVGKVVSTIEAGHTVELAVPGGTVTPVTTATSGAETRVDVDAKGNTRVAALAGDAKLTGKRPGTPPLELAAGASGLLRAKGNAERGDTVVPAYFDHELDAAALPAVTIHDPAGATALRFTFADKCPGTGAVEVDTDSSFRMPRITAGKDAANLLLRAGSWSYRVRCGGVGTPVASGRIIIIRDRGTRPLPDDPLRFPIDADGRTYRMSYQSRIPDVQIRAKGTGVSYELHFVAAEGKEQVFKNATGTFVIPGTSLRELTYTFYTLVDGKKSKVSTLIVGFDQTAAQVYIEAPVDGRAWPAQIEVRGATLPGWTAQIAGTPVPSDPGTRRFHTTIAAPTQARAIAIVLAHAQRGVHVYLRRRAAAP
jgi:hypothetical protein